MSESMARIDFLGTGNAFCPSGRMHALAIIDKKILIDAPPTLIPQLRGDGISPSQIDHVLFTHWHGDHVFGFPFLLLDRKFISDPSGERVLEIHLRPGGKEYLSNICEMGFPGSLGDWFNSRAIWNDCGSISGAEQTWLTQR